MNIIQIYLLTDDHIKCLILTELIYKNWTKWSGVKCKTRFQLAFFQDLKSPSYKTRYGCICDLETISMPTYMCTVYTSTFFFVNDVP